MQFPLAAALALLAAAAPAAATDQPYSITCTSADGERASYAAAVRLAAHLGVRGGQKCTNTHGAAGTPLGAADTADARIYGAPAHFQYCGGLGRAVQFAVGHCLRKEDNTVR